MKSFFLLAIVLSFMSQPTFAQLQEVQSGVYRWADHPVKVGTDRESRQILEGSSPHFEYLEIHATTQFVGAQPSTAHANEDVEELIIVMDGLLKISIEADSQILGAGSVISLMPQQMHSIENVGDIPLTYFVMRYRSRNPMDLARGADSGGSLMLNVAELPLQPSSRGASRRYFDRATAMCQRFEMHVTQLHSKGPSHEPHAHGETEIILVLSGKTDMMIDGERYEASAGDFYFVAADLHHGVGNATDQPCSYFAFKWN